MKDYNKIEELADEFGVNTAETTIGMNGYPIGLNLVLADFKSITSLGEVVNNLERRFPLSEVSVIELTRRDGQQLWNRADTVSTLGMYTRAGEHDWTIEFDPETDSSEKIAFEVVAEGRDLSDYDDLIRLYEQTEHFKGELDAISERTTVFYDPDNHYKIDYMLTDEATGYSYDTRTTKLGIMVDFSEEDLVATN